MSEVSAVVLDDELIKQMVLSMDSGERAKLLRVSVLPWMRPRTFQFVVGEIQRDMLVRGTKVLNSDVEALSGALFEFVRRNPISLRKLDTRRFLRIVDSIGLRSRQRSLHTIGMQIVFGFEILRNTDRLLSARPDARIKNFLVQLLNTPFKERKQVLEIVNRHQLGKDLMSQLAKERGHHSRYLAWRN